MDRQYFLAIDIGASSGRHIVFWKEHQTIRSKEIYRFKNQIVKRKGYECWDLTNIFHHILEGMKACADHHMIPSSMAIDTWGVDFVLLDEHESIIPDSICYRDHRCDQTMEKVFTMIPKTEIYQRTGIQFQQINTLFQLYETMQVIDQTKVCDFLMIPDYFNYLLSGQKYNEITNASTTQLLNVETQTWDRELLKAIGCPVEIFKPLIQPGTLVGTLRPDVEKTVGYQCDVRACTSHDTAAAFLTTYEKPTITISSGTWSLIGINTDRYHVEASSMQHNYTNEIGYEGSIRFLKNIMGLWMMQELKSNLQHQYTFAQLCSMAEEAEETNARLDVADARFLKPDNMMDEIAQFCVEHHMQVPKTPGEYAQCICVSLATAYREAITQLETITGEDYEHIIVVGGGVQNEYLNRTIEKICKKPVIRGPQEATALGNVLSQMVAASLFPNMKTALLADFDNTQC